MNAFDLTTEEKPIAPDLIAAPNLTSLKTMSTRQFRKVVFEVFHRLGGVRWLLSQAVADPRGFLDLLKKFIPTNIAFDLDNDFQITLVDRFGNSITVDGPGADGGFPNLPNSRQPVALATPLVPPEESGSTSSEGSEERGAESEEVFVQDRFGEGGSPQPINQTMIRADATEHVSTETVTGNNLDKELGAPVSSFQHQASPVLSDLPPDRSTEFDFTIDDE